MQHYLPFHLVLPSTFHFFNLQFSRLYSKVIVLHTENIRTICQQSTSPSLARLRKSVFWETLQKEQENNPEKYKEIEKWHEIWKAIAPLAHLNTKQMIALLEEEILPLERGYYYFVKESEDEDILQQVRENLRYLERLKKHIEEGLILRAKVSEMLKAPRNVDDILAVLISKINKLDILDSPIIQPLSLSATLNDDRRLKIFFITKNQAVLSSLPMRGFNAFRSQKMIDHDLKKMNAFCHKILTELDLGNVAENLYEMTQPRAERSSGYFYTFLVELREKIKEKLASLGFQEIESHLMKIRFLVYFLLSFGAYAYLMQIIQPILSLFVSYSTINTISSLLFYSMGLAPLWYLAWVGGRKMIHHAYQYLICWKKQQILDTLITLEKIQHLINNQLSQVIIDIPNFDIAELDANIEKAKAQLLQAKKALMHFSWGEKRLCRGKVMAQIEEIIHEIDAKWIFLEEKARQFAEHIASRVEDEIELLDVSLTTKKLLPVLPADQLIHLENFVKKYGNEEIINQFLANTHIVDKWLNKIAKNKHVNNDDVRSFNQPWGKQSVQLETLLGWNSILSAFAKNAKQQHACLEINALLMGKRQMTKEELKKAISDLGCEEKAAQIMKVIQAFLFNTLHPNMAHNASLLSKEHKETIAEWYQQYQINIKAAIGEIENVFLQSEKEEVNQNQPPLKDRELKDIYELLDGADIYGYAMGEFNALKDRHNRVREYFENENGESSFGYRLVCFLPRHEQTMRLPEIAQKRLKWILLHLEERKTLKPFPFFDKIDMQLFHDIDLLLQSEVFNFTDNAYEILKQNQLWHNPLLPTFLEACSHRGFAVSKLKTEYEKKTQPFSLWAHSPSHSWIALSDSEDPIIGCERSNKYVRS